MTTSRWLDCTVPTWGYRLYCPSRPRAMRCHWAAGIAVLSARALAIAVVHAHVPVAGLYSSAVLTAVSMTSIPPAANTFPLGNRTAAKPPRGLFIAPVVVHCPVAGVNRSALERVIEAAVSAAGEEHLPAGQQERPCGIRAA